MNTVLVQELQRYNNLIVQIQFSLNSLIKAIKGQIIMTDELDKLMGKILDNQVGEWWHKYSYPSLKPLSAWLVNLK
jgi:dynein heavy chain